LSYPYGHKEYLIEFASDIKIKDKWVSDKVLACYNVLREEMTLAQRQLGNSAATCYTKIFNSNSSTPFIPLTYDKNRMNSKASKHHRDINNIDFSEHNYCHHCKQFKANYIMSKCQYNSKKHGLMIPALSIVNGI
jgi:hypothetical protein